MAIHILIFGGISMPVSRSKRLGNIGLAALAVLTLGGVSIAVADSMAANKPAPVSEKVQDYYNENVASAKPTLAKAPKAAFIGDSYTQGTGASNEDHRWVNLVSKNKGWAIENDGRGGTGYLTTAGVSGCGLAVCPNYQDMVSQAVAANPAVVVVAGGQNDFSSFEKDPAAVTDAIQSTYQSLRAKLPDAKIIAVGPSTPWAVNAAATGLDRAVQDAAAKVGATYVSLLNPNVIKPDFVIADKAHVNDAGHAAIAERVESALR